MYAKRALAGRRNVQVVVSPASEATLDQNVELGTMKLAPLLDHQGLEHGLIDQPA